MRRIKTKLLLGLIVILSVVPIASGTAKVNSFTYYHAGVDFDRQNIGIGKPFYFQLKVGWGSESWYMTGIVFYKFSWDMDTKEDSGSSPDYVNINNDLWTSHKIPYIVPETISDGEYYIQYAFQWKENGPSDWLKFATDIDDSPQFKFNVVDSEVITETVYVTETSWVTETTVVTNIYWITSYTTEIVYKTSWVTKEIIITKQTADFVALSFIALALVGITLRRWRKRE